MASTRPPPLLKHDHGDEVIVNQLDNWPIPSVTHVSDQEQVLRILPNGIVVSGNQGDVGNRKTCFATLFH